MTGVRSRYCTWHDEGHSKDRRRCRVDAADRHTSRRTPGQRAARVRIGRWRNGSPPAPCSCGPDLPTGAVFDRSVTRFSERDRLPFREGQFLSEVAAGIRGHGDRCPHRGSNPLKAVTHDGLGDTVSTKRCARRRCAGCWFEPVTTATERPARRGLEPEAERPVIACRVAGMQRAGRRVQQPCPRPSRARLRARSAGHVTDESNPRSSRNWQSDGLRPVNPGARMRRRAAGPAPP